MLTDEAIARACDQHGAGRVSEAAYAAMSGQRAALSAVGLAEAAGLGELHRITTVAYELMEPHERAADLTQATIDGAKL